MAQREKIKLSVIQQQTLTDMQEDIVWLEGEIARASSIGIAVEEMEKNVVELIRVRDGLLREYSG